ncbi:MAG: tetratricopeptide repeat protein [Deltaproteobacteria bacterium]|nr:tetratricopeptide repeat protein [Deltaproteobacteria bacterium]
MAIRQEPMAFNELFHFLPLLSLKQKLGGMVAKNILSTTFDEEAYDFYNKDYFPTLIHDEMLDAEERYYWHEKIAKYLSHASLRSAKAGEAISRDTIEWHRCYSHPSSQTFRSIFRLARKLLAREGDVVRARTLLEYGIEKIPTNRSKLFACLAAQLMDAYQQEGRYEKAEKVFEKAKTNFGSATKENIWSAILDTKMLGLSLQQGHFEKAKGMLEKGIVKGPPTLRLTWKNYEARYYYELSQRDVDRKMELLNQAKELFEKNKKAEKLLPQDLQLKIKNNNLGLVLMNLGDYKAAVKELGEKLGHHKKKGNLFGILSILINLADTYRMLKNFKTAIIHAKQAVELAKKTTQGKWLNHAHKALANVYHDGDQFEKALLEDDRCLASSSVLSNQQEHFQNCMNIWTHKGHCYKELKQFDKAIVHFQTVLEAKASPLLMMWGHEGIGEVYFLKGEMEQSLKRLRKAKQFLEKTPSDFAEGYQFPIIKFLIQIYCWLNFKSGLLKF